MYNLKMNFTFLSLIALFTLSIFTYSCAKEEAQEMVVNTPSPQENIPIAAPIDERLVLPKGMEADPDLVTDYLNAAEDAIFSKLKENYRTMEFLRGEELYELVYNGMKDGQHLADVNLTKYFTEEQTIRFSSFSLDSQVESRCIACTNYGQYNGSWCWYGCYNYCATPTSSYNGNYVSWYVYWPC